MQIVDVNVLVALVISTHPTHERAWQWWEEAVATGEPFSVPDLVWVGLVRTLTNHRVLAAPLSFDEAWQAAERLAGDQRYRRLRPGPEVLRAFDRVGREARARGNLVTDAYIAAVAVSLGAAVVTFDRDFRKFDGVRVIEPA